MDLVKGLFKDLVWDVLVDAALARLFAAVPFLAFGPIKVVVTWLITKFLNEFYEEVSKWVKVELIEFRNEQFQKSWEVAQVKLKLIARGSAGIDSEEFKNERIKHRSQLSNLVRFDVARTG